MIMSDLLQDLRMAATQAEAVAEMASRFAEAADNVGDREAGRMAVEAVDAAHYAKKAAEILAGLTRKFELADAFNEAEAEWTEHE